MKFIIEELVAGRWVFAVRGTRNQTNGDDDAASTFDSFIRATECVDFLSEQDGVATFRIREDS